MIKNIEQNLVESARNGNEEAIVALLEKCQPDLHRFSRKMCSTSEDAEEAVQVALWVLYRRIGALRTAATLSSWLFRIVERECYRIFRKKKDSNFLDEPQFLEPSSPEAQVDLHIDLSKAIISLPYSYRTVLILRDINELTAPEVADKLGLSIEAVKSRLHRARTIVRKRLEANGYIGHKIAKDMH
ncbi:RNA polymerase sigma factor [Serratia sp. 2723]|uniref:RNA polymerase sigma factor n=1 Tax=unclassified Serratia (in: enterobacteria) TaxID=2647522 RepID=UPI003D1E260F